MEGMEGQNVLETESQISVHNFTDTILGNSVYFHLIKLCNSFHICVGTTPVMKNMAVAMQTDFDRGLSSGSILLGDLSDPVSLNMAQRLAKRTGKQVFVSCSVPYDQNLTPLLEKRISEEIKMHPEKFWSLRTKNAVVMDYSLEATLDTQTPPRSHSLMVNREVP